MLRTKLGAAGFGATLAGLRQGKLARVHVFYEGREGRDGRTGCSRRPGGGSARGRAAERSRWSLGAFLFISLGSLGSLGVALPIPARAGSFSSPQLTLPETVSHELASEEARARAPHPDDESKEPERPYRKLTVRRKVKDCCGYPLGQPSSYKMTFYWLAYESEYANEPYTVDIYTRRGFPLGRFPQVFVFELKLEGSAVLRNGQVLNYDGRCPYGVGICFQTLEPRTHPLGKGGQGRALLPFRSVAVDPRFVPLGTPIYLPEVRGLLLPDGTHHDGCVRAEDTGGGIKRKELDLFVESYANYRFLDEQFGGTAHVTPHVEEPRCEYLRSTDAVLDRKSEATDYGELHPKTGAKPQPTLRTPQHPQRPQRPHKSKPRRRR